MNRLFLLACAAVIVLLPACKSYRPVVTEKISDMETGFPGTIAYYALPRTVVVVDVEVQETREIPGPYAEYAETSLGLNDVIFKPSTSYRITGISVSGFAEPDPDQYYYVRFHEDEEKSLYVSLNESGIIYSVNKEPGGYEYHPSHYESRAYHDFGTEVTFNYFMDSILKEQIDTIVEVIPFDTITLSRQTLRRSWVEKSPRQRAQEVAEHILDIREKKLDLISGFQEITYSKEALEYMYREMDNLENDYLDLFTGITSTRKMHYRFVHRPDKEDIVRRHPLFRFSKQEGLLPTNAASGFPATILYDRSSATDKLRDQIGTYSETGRRKPKKGFHYRIPEYADLTVHVGTEKRAEARMLISQFGIVTNMPAGDFQIEFHPATGSIKSIKKLPLEDD